ncbi:MAG TPA: hypothetical protein VMM60_07260 [Ilumatobacter sp.]|nr:hypothetical protein [Ilumatobacter sp.]
MTGPASFHVLTDTSAARSLRRLIGDRRWARRQHGAQFIRVLGTSRGMSTGWSTDPRRNAVFAVWSSNDALAAFVASGATGHPSPGVTGQHFALRLISGHGAWGGEPLLDLITAADDGHTGEVAVVTRANVRLLAWPQFVHQGRLVSDSAKTEHGLVDLLGFGEAPIGPVGTFSRWTSPHAVQDFHAQNSAHREASRRERSGGWFRTELFARFAATDQGPSG